MTRIDQALRRAGEPRPGRAQNAPVRHPGPRTLEDVTFEPYPTESATGFSGHDVTDPPEAPATRADGARAADEPCPFQQPVGTAAGAAPPVRDGEPPLPAALQPALAEQYVRIAASVHAGQIARGLKTVVVTSAVAGEGRTSTAVHLAYTLARVYGRRVLIVDADRHRPRLHEIFGIQSEVGLGEALRSEGEQASLPAVLSPFVSLLTAGEVEGYPFEGLVVERMQRLLDAYGARFDSVVLDTAPLGALPDGRLLARMTQAAVFVIGGASTPFPVVERAMAELGREYILGTVLQGIGRDAARTTGQPQASPARPG